MWLTGTEMYAQSLQAQWFSQNADRLPSGEHQMNQNKADEFPNCKLCCNYDFFFLERLAWCINQGKRIINN